jgi:hypothetical protein
MEPEPTSSREPEPTDDPETPAPSLEPPAPSCPRLSADRGFGTIGSDTDLYLSLELETVAPIDGGESFAVPQRWNARQASFFVGGRETRLQPSYDDNRPADIVMTELSLRLIMDDGSRHEADARFEPGEDGANVAVVGVPDVEGWGTVRISLAWRDSCYDVVARTSNRVIVSQPASIAECAAGRNKGFDELGATFEAPLQVGTLEASLAPWLFDGKVAPLWVIDPYPPFVGFTRESPTMTVSPGTIVTVVNTNPEVDLRARDDKVVAFERGPLIRWLEGGFIHGDEPEAEVVFRSNLVTNADGTYGFTAPDAPGRYAMQAMFDYDAACSYGNAGFVVGVDVE